LLYYSSSYYELLEKSTACTRFWVFFRTGGISQLFSRNNISQHSEVFFKLLCYYLLGKLCIASTSFSLSVMDVDFSALLQSSSYSELLGEKPALLARFVKLQPMNCFICYWCSSRLLQLYICVHHEEDFRPNMSVVVKALSRLLINKPHQQPAALDTGSNA
jgi:hypothetical protein